MATKKRAPKGKLGAGSRFKAVVAGVKASNRKKGRKKMQDPEAVAASIGRKVYGKTKFQQMAAAGRKRAAAKRRRK